MNVGGQAVTDATYTETFESGTPGNDITNQFSANGLTFQTLGTAGIALTSNNICNNMSGGMSGKYLSMGMRYPCSANTAYNAVSMMFDKDITELSWMGFNRTLGDGFTIQAFHDGQLVSPEYQFSSFNKFDKQTIVFNGGLFDEIRFLENANHQGFFGIDNMAWKVAAVTPPPVADVPEPSIALLFGLGMFGIGFMRKKSTK